MYLRVIWPWCQIISSTFQIYITFRVHGFCSSFEFSFLFFLLSTPPIPGLHHYRIKPFITSERGLRRNKEEMSFLAFTFQALFKAKTKELFLFKEADRATG